MRMSGRNLRRIEVLSEVLVGRRTMTDAAKTLGMTERHAYRLLAKYYEEETAARPAAARKRRTRKRAG
jgi:transposase